MNINAVIANVPTALVSGNYNIETRRNFQKIHSASWRGYVNDVFDLTSFLKVVAGINNGTEKDVVLQAVQLSINKSNP